MKIDNTLVSRLAELAKLEFDKESLENIKKDLSSILELVEKLNELNTDNVEPLVYMSKELNITRTDKVNGLITKAEALKNAPEKNSDYIKVPKVIEKM